MIYSLLTKLTGFVDFLSTNLVNENGFSSSEVRLAPSQPHGYGMEWTFSSIAYQFHSPTTTSVSLEAEDFLDVVFFLLDDLDLLEDLGFSTLGPPSPRFRKLLKEKGLSDPSSFTPAIFVGQPIKVFSDTAQTKEQVQRTVDSSSLTIVSHTHLK